MAKYCKKCQCPINQNDSDYCLFHKTKKCKKHRYEIFTYKDKPSQIECMYCRKVKK